MRNTHELRMTETLVVWANTDCLLSRISRICKTLILPEVFGMYTPASDCYKPFVLGGIEPRTVSATFHSSCAHKTFITGRGCLKGSHLAETHGDIHLQRGNTLQMSTTGKILCILTVFKSRSIWFIIVFSLRGKQLIQPENRHGGETERLCLKCLLTNICSNYLHVWSQNAQSNNCSGKIPFLLPWCKWK